MSSCKGRIHSTESFGSVDGPGIRFVVFMQGCGLRCAYCHNADTWALGGGTEADAEEVLKKALRYRSYWKKNGGITVSGGEPLLQIDFVTELFRLAKAEGVNTALDTAGGPFNRSQPFFGRFKALMEVTDLVILDIKHTDPEKHKALTGKTNENILDMARCLSDMGKPVWVRRVLVPGLTDDKAELGRLKSFIASLGNVEKTEVLPYHSMGAYKWERLGAEYRLKDVRSPSAEEIKAAEEILGITHQ